MFKKLALNILIVAAVVFVLDFAIGKTLRHFYFKETSGLHYRTTYSMDSTRAEILVFGSSRANHNYVPEVFEDSLKETFYNAGRDGNGILYQLALLNAVLNRYTPKIIILEYSGEFNKEQSGVSRVPSLLPYYRTHKEIRNIIAGTETKLDKIKMLSEIYPFNSQALTIAIGNTEINKKRMYDNKGYVALHKEWKYELDSVTTQSHYELDSVKVNAFEKFIKTAMSRRIKVFVISSPIFQKNPVNPGIEKCNEICTAQKVPFLNYQADSFFLKSRSLFQDILHLNNKGAIEFSKRIASTIVNYKFEDQY